MHSLLGLFAQSVKEKCFRGGGMVYKIEFENWWNKWIDKAFVGNERQLWMPYMKELSEAAWESAFKEGRKSAFQELIGSGELPNCPTY